MPICTVALMRHGGSHLIRPIVNAMGYDIIEPGNFGAPLDAAEGPVIVFVRDPRDRMASTLRWWMNKRKSGLSPEKNSDNQMLFLLKQQGFLREMIQWAEIWCNWWGALSIRFENLRIYGSIEIGVIAQHLSVSCNSNSIFDNVFEKSSTFTGKYSNWQDYFGERSKEFWELNGGPELLRLMGYE